MAWPSRAWGWLLRLPTREKRGVEAEPPSWPGTRNTGSSLMDIEHFSVEADPTFADVRFLEDRLYEVLTR